MNRNSTGKLARTIAVLLLVTGQSAITNYALADDYTEAIKSQIDSQSSASQLEMLRLQQTINKRDSSLHTANQIVTENKPGVNANLYR